MTPEKYIKEINGYYLLEEAVHPKTGEVFKIGDYVIKTDDHIMYGSGKKYWEKINTMFCTKDSDYIYCSQETFKDSDYKKSHWTQRPQGYFLNEVERKISIEEIRKIEKAKSLANDFI